MAYMNRHAIQVLTGADAENWRTLWAMRLIRKGADGGTS